MSLSLTAIFILKSILPDASIATSIFFWSPFAWNSDFPGGSDGKASAYSVGEPGSIPGSERRPGEGNGNPLQYSCLENPMDRGAW